MVRNDKAKAVYDAMTANCPDCHHPWGEHLTLMAHELPDTAGCLHRAVRFGDFCPCEVPRPDGLPWQHQEEYDNDQR